MLDKKKTVALILAQMKPHKGVSVEMEEPGESGEEEMSHDEQLHAIADELVSAVRSGNTRGVVEALRGAFACLDSEPHVEGQHIKALTEEEENMGEGEEPFDHESSESAGYEAAEHLAGKKYKYGGRAMYAEGGEVEQLLENARYAERFGGVKQPDSAALRQMDNKSVGREARRKLESMQKTAAYSMGGSVGDVLRKHAKGGKVGGSKMAQAILASLR